MNKYSYSKQEAEYDSIVVVGDLFLARKHSGQKILLNRKGEFIRVVDIYDKYYCSDLKSNIDFVNTCLVFRGCGNVLLVDYSTVCKKYLRNNYSDVKVECEGATCKLAKENSSEYLIEPDSI